MLRTALSLSIATGSPFRIHNIRARRSHPGLRRQHLTAVRAAQAVSSAAVEGAGLGASDITFTPGQLKCGRHTFDIGTAGSTTLVAQTLIPALMRARAPFRITLKGGTHNPMSPPFDFLQRAYLPLLRRMGPIVEATLVRRGFYPAGGGRLDITIDPIDQLSPIELCNRGALLAREANAVVSRLPLSIAHRELATIRNVLGWPDDVLHAREDEQSDGPGNVVTLDLAFEELTEVFTGFGERGVPAEKVAGNAARRVLNYLDGDAAVGIHLADQLLVPMAIAGGGRFTTLRPSRHATTNARIIQMFLPVRIDIEQIEKRVWSVAIRQVTEATDRR